MSASRLFKASSVRSCGDRKEAFLIFHATIGHETSAQNGGKANVLKLCLQMMAIFK